MSTEPEVCPACGADVGPGELHDPPCSGCMGCGNPWGDGYNEVERQNDRSGLCRECFDEGQRDDYVDRLIDERRGK